MRGISSSIFNPHPSLSLKKGEGPLDHKFLLQCTSVVSPTLLGMCHPRMFLSGVN